MTLAIHIAMQAAPPTRIAYSISSPLFAQSRERKWQNRVAHAFQNRAMRITQAVDSGQTVK